MNNRMSGSEPQARPATNVPHICRMLKVLANPKRLQILLHLIDGELSVSDIESTLNIKQPNLSHELRNLRNADLVSTRRVAKLVLYRLKNEAVKALLLSVCDSLVGTDHQLGKSSVLVAQSERNAECGIFANIGLKASG